MFVSKNLIAPVRRRAKNFWNLRAIGRVQAGSEHRNGAAVYNRGAERTASTDRAD
jgi:hypothetical protein